MHHNLLYVFLHIWPLVVNGRLFFLNRLESLCQCEFSLFSHHSENFYVPVTVELCILMVAHGEPYITLVPFQAKYTFEEKEGDVNGTVIQV